MTTEYILDKTERYRLLAEYSTDIISTLTPEGIYTFVSPAVKAIMGFEPEELIGTQCYDLIHPDDIQAMGTLYVKMITEKGKITFAYRILNKANHYIWLETTSQPILNQETGEIEEIIVVSRDITERIEHQEKMEKQIANVMEELELRVEERTKLLSLANGALHDEIHMRKVITEQMGQKNKEITDSIQYARRIQKAVLPKNEQFYKMFPQSFILSKAKDIVNGDFLWFHDSGDKQVVALVDCSGHGVPGAFMSIIGNHLLNDIVIDEGCSSPSKILHLLEERLITALCNGNPTEDLKDGMDIGICVIDRTTNKANFAGAYRPLFVRDANGTMHEINGNPFSIGGGVCGRMKDFEEHSVNLQPGMTFYITSDGYYSQFGGADGKKFMKSRFRETVATISNQPIETQKDELLKIFEAWQGKNEQVDDVLVVGFRI